MARHLLLRFSSEARNVPRHFQDEPQPGTDLSFDRGEVPVAHETSSRVMPRFSLESFIAEMSMARMTGGVVFSFSLLAIQYSGPATEVNCILKPALLRSPARPQALRSALPRSRRCRSVEAS